jgi:hypothetical protein
MAKKPTPAQKSEDAMKTLQDLAKEALRVQDACALRGVARGLVRAITDLEVTLLGLHSEELYQHPITQAWVSKLASLAGVPDNQSKIWQAVEDIAEGKTP